LNQLKAIELLTTQIDEITALSQLPPRSPEWNAWRSHTHRLIEEIWGKESTQVKQFHEISFSLKGYISSTPVSAYQKAYIDGLKSAQFLLGSFIKELVEFSEKNQSACESVENENKISTRIFIVHGHEDLPKEQLARFLTNRGLEPIILHEQPNQGRTIIEKFEETCSDVGFAFVIMTPDDLGMDVKSYEKMQKGDASVGLNFRARQNVIFELGFFFAKLGRGRVCCLLKGNNIEKPSDYDGIVDIRFRDKIEEKYMDIIRELQTANYQLDLSKI
jgi:predicted nucleotide-binding protein